MALSTRRHLRFWAIAAVSPGVLSGPLHPSRAPFITGEVIGHLLDPIVNRLEHRQVPRWLATLAIQGAFMAAMTVAVILLAPLATAAEAGQKDPQPAHAGPIKVKRHATRGGAIA